VCVMSDGEGVREGSVIKDGGDLVKGQRGSSE